MPLYPPYAKDDFQKFSIPTGGAAVTPNDNTDLTRPSILYVGLAGNVVVTTNDGEDITLVGVSGFVPVLVSRVKSTGTTATSIVALY